jgi:small neutral amino acid transporter SnatA (MarC family)
LKHNSLQQITKRKEKDGQGKSVAFLPLAYPSILSPTRMDACMKVIVFEDQNKDSSKVLLNCCKLL